MATYATEPIYKEIKSALQVLHIDKQRLQSEGYRAKSGLWGRIVSATGKPNSLIRRRQFFDVWRKRDFTSQCEPQELQGSSLESPAYPTPAPAEFDKTDQLLKTKNDSEGISKVYGSIKHSLSTDEVVRLLTNVDVSKVSSLQPEHPKPGELYMYKYRKGQENEGKDRTLENAPWTNMGIKHVPHRRGHLKVRYFIARGEGREIRRRIYEMSEKVAPYKLVHYLDENSRLQRPRRQVRFGQQPLAQTTPPQEELKKVEEELDLPDFQVQKITEYSPASSKPPAETLTPTSMEQNPNTGKQSRQGVGFLNPKDIMATQMMCRELKDFVIHMSVYPDVIVVAALPEMIEQFQTMVKNSGPCVLHVLYYNKTFALENFYVTPLLFCHNDFEECPAVPLAFLIHQCQQERAHSIFLEELLCLLPDLNSNRFVIWIDCDAVVENSVKTVLPNASALNSFDQLMVHLRDKVEMFCEGDDRDYDVRKYMKNLRALLWSETEEHWRVRLGNFSVIWSSAFLEYFQMHLEFLTKRAARFTLKELGLPQGEMITTTFQRFSLMLQQMLDGKLRLETTVFAAFQLLIYFLNEVLRSRCNNGPYRPTPASTRSATAIDNVDFPECVMIPEEIVHFVKDSLTDDAMPEQEVSKGYDPASKRAMAKLIIWKNKITLEARLKSFFVTGWRGQKYIVKLYPEERCSCFVAQHCCHILAARTAIGLEEEKKEKPTFRIWKMCRTTETTQSGEKGSNVVPLKEVMLTPCSPVACRGDANSEHFLIEIESSSSASESSESCSEEVHEDSE